eukprot:1139763-Pelagomonas_calceolata.AAC.5
MRLIQRSFPVRSIRWWKGCLRVRGRGWGLQVQGLSGGMQHSAAADAAAAAAAAACIANCYDGC